MPTFNYNGVNLGEGALQLPKRITAGSEEGRAWFARGWFHILNYNHEEAINCFQQCLEVDPICVMGHWGIAYSVSSSYNFPPGLGSGFDPIQAAIAGIQKAETGAKDESGYKELEKDLIFALAARSSAESKAAIDPTKMFFGNLPELNQKFAEEMSQVYTKYGCNNLDVTAVYAESLMVLKPWTLWVKDANTDLLVPADENTLRVKKVLDEAMAAPGGMEHPAILHLYCHLMELSPDPEAAMPAANALRTLLPAAGHLTHMASHIDVWAGKYKDALAANQTSINADAATVVFTGCESNFYKGYRLHNVHMAVWAALFTGEKRVALQLARAMDDMLPPGDSNSGVRHTFLEVIPLGLTAAEPYCMTKWHVMIRFGMWDDILSEPHYEDPTLYATGVASRHYARGLAFAAKGFIEEAEDEQASYLSAMQNPALEGRRVHNNLVMTEQAPCILKVGEATLAGEIEYRKGNFALAFDHLREAVRRDLGLLYDEPWGWMVPAEHALGALLLEQGHVLEATNVFRSNLKMYKENMWGLLGLYQCLEKAGDPQADAMKRRFNDAARFAEVKPSATCFCAAITGAEAPLTEGSSAKCCDKA